MMIDKIAGTSPISNVQGSRAARDVMTAKPGSDSISVSEEAQYMSALYYADQVAAQTPDVRADKVAEAKALLANPNWPDMATLSATADKIMSAFGL